MCSIDRAIIEKYMCSRLSPLECGSFRSDSRERTKVMWHTGFVVLLLCLSTDVFSLDQRPLRTAAAAGLTKPDRMSTGRAIGPDLKISPFARVGFQRMGMELITPMPFLFSFQQEKTIGGGSLALRIREMTLWVAEGGVEAQLVNNLKVFVKGSGNLMQRIAMNLAPDLVDSMTLSEWRRNDLRWMTLEGGVERHWKGPIAVLGGLRWDHFLLVVREPTPPEGSADNASGQVIPSGADLSANFIIPYAGIRLRKGQLTAQAIAGTPPYSRIRLGTRFHQTLGSSQNVAGIADVNFLGLGVFFELSGEYNTTVHKKLHLTLWGRAGILGSRGRGDAEIRYVSADPTALIRPMETDHSVRFFRHAFTGGIAIETPF